MPMSSIAERLLDMHRQLPQGVTLVAVSKYHPAEDLMQAYAAGQRVFGENIVQELRTKQEMLPKDIQWHFIGHLQTNKVKYIAPFVAMIHAVDSYHLLEEINRQALKNGRTIPVLLQIHVAKEETKFGFSFEECTDMLSNRPWRKLQGVEISGLMCIASNTEDTEQVKAEFHSMNTYFGQLKDTFFAHSTAFARRSWGMSDDWPLALAAGSNMVRIGSHIFGPRTYPNP